jgi:4-amino-4-deoxy-L-arabinose transferase-like glycosyltransferase
MLLSFLCLTHLGVMLCFCAGTRVSPFVAPVALLASLGLGDWLARREGLRGRWRIAPTGIVLALVVLALLLAASFFDFGWDGQWYHQTAVYQMAHGWNPLRDPMHDFVPRHVELMLRHYSKGPWFTALALFEATNDIEWAKAGTWLALAAMFFAVLAAGLDLGLRRWTAWFVAALVSLNPVAVCESASYLVDGLLVSFLACFVAALFRWFRGSSLLARVVLLTSAALCINVKLTGLVYLCFACAAGGLFALVERRDLLLRYVAVQITAVLLGVVVFGFNPYVTNTLHRGNPFYPLLGTAAHPGIGNGTDNPIDRYETPRNMVGRNRVVRLGYAILGRPGAQPYYGGENARLMWPFDVGWADFQMFRIHGVRISGFGPLFSGAFLVSLVLLAIAVVRPGVPRMVALLFAGTILISLLISTHTWWARLGPQLWWLPVMAVIAGLAAPGWHAVRWTAWGLAALLLANAMLVAFAHFRWEIQATRTLHEQMASLRTKGVVNVNFHYFREPFGERLRTAGVSFRAVRNLQCDDPMELTSVAPGYPFAVQVCVHEKHEDKPAGTQPAN